MKEHFSFIADVLLTGGDSCVQSDRVLLKRNLLLVKSGYFCFQEVHLINILLLNLQVVSLEVGEILNHFFQDVVTSFSSMVFQSSAFRSE